MRARAIGEANHAKAFRIQMLVEARLEGWSKPCSGMIMRNNRDETYNIAFDDGHRVEGVHATHIRSLKMGGFAADAFRALPQAHGVVLYSIGRKVVLEAPRHVCLFDGKGRRFGRGQECLVKRALPEPARAGSVQYLVEPILRDASRRTEFTVQEGWLRPAGLLATSTDCEFLCLEDILKSVGASGGFEVPLFQRRYCWGEEQWEPLWQCVLETARRRSEDQGATHSLKKLLCLKRPGKLVCLDGQQRLTTCCVLLAALRDHATTAVPALSRRITALLSPPGGGVMLRPTLDDRADFGRALAQASAAAPVGAVGEGGPLLRCRVFFSACLGQLPTSEATAAVGEAVLRGLHMLLFPVAGSVQMQAIYEGHAAKAEARAGEELWAAREHVRDEYEVEEKRGFSRLTDEQILEIYRKHRVGPHGIAEHGMAMSPVDLIRNFVHDHFEGEVEQRRVHAEVWMPMERACSTAAGQGVEVWKAMETAFAKALQGLTRERAAPSGMAIYGAFQEWWDSNAGAGAERRLRAFAEEVAKAWGVKRKSPKRARKVSTVTHK